MVFRKTMKGREVLLKIMTSPWLFPIFSIFITFLRQIPPFNIDCGISWLGTFLKMHNDKDFFKKSVLIIFSLNIIVDILKRNYQNRIVLNFLFYESLNL